MTLLDSAQLRPYYADDLVTLFHGDAFKIIPHIDRVDHVITDPPFSDHTHRKAKSLKETGKGRDARLPQSSTIDFESITLDRLRLIFSALQLHGARWIVSSIDFRHAWELEARPPVGLDYIRTAVWMKTNPMPQLTGDRPAQGWEAIAILHAKDKKKLWFGGGNHSNYVGPIPNRSEHPTGKPLPMVRRWIDQFTLPGELIIDPFAGAGTTLEAAKQLGRRAIGIELDERYCEAAARRLRQEILLFG